MTGVPTPKGIEIDCWVNEEGLFREGFIRNKIASAFTGVDCVGPAIFTSADDEGNTIPLPNGYLQGAMQAGLKLEGEAREYVWGEVAMELMNIEQDYLVLLDKMEEVQNDKSED